LASADTKSGKLSRDGDANENHLLAPESEKTEYEKYLTQKLPVIYWAHSDVAAGFVGILRSAFATMNR
jgi:hypothetical protein